MLLTYVDKQQTRHWLITYSWDLSWSLVSFKIPIQGKTDGSSNKLFINVIKIKNK